MSEPLYVVLSICTVSQSGPTIVRTSPTSGLADAQRLFDRYTLAAAGRSCCRYELHQLLPVTTSEETRTDGR